MESIKSRVFGSKLHSRLHAVMGGAGLVLAAAPALGASVTIKPCTTCNTVAEFRNSAVGYAQISGKPGVYQVSSYTQARTGLVTVTGTPRKICFGNTCGWTLDGAMGVVRFRNGQPIVVDLDLNTLDVETFAADRRKPMAISISPDYAGSIINSLDEEVGPGISWALTQKGINPLSIQAGQPVLVKFQDGTKALFLKLSGLSTIQWKWAGLAWNADGYPINRDGSRTNASPLTGSLGSGGGFNNTPGAEGSSFSFVGSWSGLCATSTTITINGEAAGTYHGYIGC